MDVLIRPDNNADIEEATIALTNLGFSKPNVNKAIQTILKKNPGAKVEEIIRTERLSLIPHKLPDRGDP